VYLLWALLLQAACLVYMQLRRGSSKRWQRLGSNVLLLTANNTGLVGTPVVTAALGPEVSSLGLLIGGCGLWCWLECNPLLH
jgi:predicted permease